jgi:hypothetical protein
MRLAKRSTLPEQLRSRANFPYSRNSSIRGKSEVPFYELRRNQNRFAAAMCGRLGKYCVLRGLAE